MKRWYVSSTVLVVVAFAAVMVFGVGTAAAFQSTLEGGWYWQNPLVQGNGFNDVAVTGGSAVAVGDAGSVFTSANGGATWTRHLAYRTVKDKDGNDLQVLVRVPLLAVDFVNASTGWAVGYRAVNSANATSVTSAIVRTTDGGANWAAQELPSDGGPYELTDVSFVDANNGWATANYVVTGGRTTCTILRTVDGGTTWTVAKKWQSPVDPTHPKDAIQLLSQVDFVSPATGWATGWGFDASKPVGHQWGYVLLSTTDGGTNWAISQFGDGAARISAMDFTSAADGWLATASLATYAPATIWRTTDGGSTWSAKTTKEGATITDLAASPSGECYATGQTQSVYDWEGFVLHTADGGAAWSQEFAQQTVRPLAVGFSSSTAVAVGSGGLFLKRDPAGAWTDSTAGVRTNLTKVQFKDANLGWAVGWKSTILRTTNGGRDWKAASVPSGVSLEGLDMVTKKVGWAVGCSGPHVPYADLDAGYGAVVLKTTDGGLHWKYQVDRNSRPGLAAVDFTDTKHGVAVGTNGFVARTTNGGKSWWYRTVGSTTLRSVAFTAASTGVAVGGETGSVSGNGTIWKTTDGGVTWTDAKPQPTPTAPLRSVRFDSTTGLTAIGDNEQIYTSGDSGATWAWTPIWPQGITQDPPFARFFDSGVCTIPQTALVATNDVDAWALSDDGLVWTQGRAGTLWRSDLMGTTTAAASRAARQLGTDAPTITSIFQNQAVIGAKVVISGTGFTGATTVIFTSKVAAKLFTVDSDSQITVTVPAGATSGPVTVTTPNGTATSPINFVVVTSTHLLDHLNGSGQDNQLNSIAVVDWLNVWAVGERGTILSFDRLAPTTTISPANGWVKSPMLSLSATDPKSDVAWTRWVVDPPGIENDPTLGPIDWDGWDWQYGTTVTFGTTGDAPETKHVIYYQSLDNVGNVELDAYWQRNGGLEVPKHLWVTVDSIGPQTYAPAAASVARGKHPALTFWVNDDLSNKADVTIVVKDSGGRIVKSLKMGWLATWQQFSAPLSDWKCTLAKGAYTFSVYAKDQAGNDQALLGSNALTVR